MMYQRQVSTFSRRVSVKIDRGTVKIRTHLSELLYLNGTICLNRHIFLNSTSKSIVKLNYKIQYPRNSGSKKQSRSYFLRFFFLIHRQDTKNALR